MSFNRYIITILVLGALALVSGCKNYVKDFEANDGTFSVHYAFSSEQPDTKLAVYQGRAVYLTSPPFISEEHIKSIKYGKINKLDLKLYFKEKDYRTWYKQAKKEKGLIIKLNKKGKQILEKITSESRAVGIIFNRILSVGLTKPLKNGVIKINSLTPDILLGEEQL